MPIKISIEIKKLLYSLEQSKKGMNLFMENKYLPIGSVVKLKDGKKRLMITGFLPIENNNKEEKVWDYCGCLYPEGIIESKNNYLFDHSQIEEIHFMGLIDEEEETFKKNLNTAIEQLIKK